MDFPSTSFCCSLEAIYTRKTDSQVILPNKAPEGAKKMFVPSIFLGINGHRPNREKRGRPFYGTLTIR
jgi:hypothetical protein